MRLRRLLRVVAVALVVVAGSRPALAQERYNFQTSFDFVARGQTFVAGSYSLVANGTRDVLNLEPMNVKKAGVLLPVETRISERKALTDAEVVFDKLNGKLYLSELQVPGEDGYLVLVTKAKHTHESVKSPHAKK
ncbi:MAG: hypothetical protein NTV05_09115 [Acidobacteria bacterium]|nr:hypothetical protein [Acidobacteriota bacterium]